MRYVARFVGLAVLAIAFWANVVLLHLLLTHHCPASDESARIAAVAASAAKDDDWRLQARLAKKRSDEQYHGDGRLILLHPIYTPPARETGLSKVALVGGMNALRPQIHRCYERFQDPGTAMVNIVIAKSGRVSSAQVIGKFAGTPTGACVEAAVKTARFPRSDGFSTPYPFQLR